MIITNFKLTLPHDHITYSLFMKLQKSKLSLESQVKSNIYLICDSPVPNKKFCRIPLSISIGN